MQCRKCNTELPKGAMFCHLCGTSVAPKRRRMKRGNGTGSVYKRGDNKAYPWTAVVPARMQVDGTLKREVIGHYSTAQEAKDALDEYRRNPTTKLNITFCELYDEWQPVWVKNKSAQLAQSYAAAYAYMRPLYKRTFRDIRTNDMQHIIDDLEEKGKSYSTASNVKTVFLLLYRYALQNDIVQRNYAEFLKISPKQKKTRDVFSDAELYTIEENADIVPYADCILFLCYTGLRITEFLTLSRFQIKVQNGVTMIQGGIKTEAGKNRSVPVHEKILPILSRWMSKNGETVFCMEDGRKMSAAFFREKCYYPALEKLGIARKTPHTTRRTFATRLSAAGVSPEDLMALMGHTNFSVDMEHYIMQSASTLQKAVNRLK